MEKRYLTYNPFQTKKAGKLLAREILKSPLKKTASVIGLEGELGSGKTTFLQGFARGLDIKEKITSPTFVIMKRFQLGNWATGQLSSFYHFDCYRLQKAKEILALGFKEIISRPENIVAVEWADRIQKILPKNTIIIKFYFINPKTRKITIRYGQQKTFNYY